jgi:hypothetical protein
MINKINKERRRSMNAIPHPPWPSNKEPRRTPNKNRTGQRQSTDTKWLIICNWLGIQRKNKRRGSINPESIFFYLLLSTPTWSTAGLLEIFKMEPNGSCGCLQWLNNKISVSKHNFSAFGCEINDTSTLLNSPSKKLINSNKRSIQNQFGVQKNAVVKNNWRHVYLYTSYKA